MAKIDTSGWQPFVIGDLFEQLKLKCLKEDFNKALDVSEERTEEFNLPLVNAKQGNNGIMYYGRSSDFETSEMTIDIVQNGAISTGSVYAQPQETGVLWDAYLIKLNVDVSEFVLQFLATVIQKTIKTHYSYDHKCTWDKVKEESILLPVDSHGQPDWASMDRFMEKAMKRSKASLSDLRLSYNGKKALSLANWKRFHLYDDDLFDIDMGTKLDKSKMTELNPSVNFIGRANSNNGITGRVDAIAGIQPYEAGSMTLSLGGEYLGSCFIQPAPFYVSQNVVVLKPKKKMSFAVKQFISAVIFKESRMYYKAFIDELNRHIKTDFSFYLPTTPTGQPDWNYMETYMSHIWEESQSALLGLGF